MNNGVSREIEKTFFSLSVEPSTSLQVHMMEMGSTLPETALEGINLSETMLDGAMQSKAKSYQKRFIPLLPLFSALLVEKSLPQKSEMGAADTSISRYSYKWLLV
jgi:hypothetical protein